MRFQKASWPYGRVVAVEEAHEVPASARPEVRRNMETVMKTLSDLGVVVYEWNEATAGSRWVVSAGCWLRTA